MSTSLRFYEVLNREAEKTSIGSNGVIVLPHFERSAAPYWNPMAKGLIFNLTLGTKRADIARAILEGICLEITDNISLIEDVAGEINKVSVAGGLTRFAQGVIMKLAKPLGISLVGVGGFARSYVRSIQKIVNERLAKWSSVVIRNPDKYREEITKYRQQKITIYSSYEKMLEKERNRTDIVALPTPIPTHSTMTIAALKAGYNVIVEKPPTSTIQELDEMIAAEEFNSGSVAVGFQSLSKNTVRSIKQVVVRGELGAIKEVAVKARWSRLDSYYTRNPWAGKLMLEGRYVLDGPSNNALSHYLNDALYYACPVWHETELPVRVRSELYRAHDIESEDTSCTQVKLASGAMVYFYVTHCCRDDFGPICEITGTKGSACWERNGPATFKFHDGRKRVVEYDRRDERDEVFRNFIGYLQGIEKEINCTLLMTRPFVLTLNGIFLSSQWVKPIPEEYVIRQPARGSTRTEVKNIDEIIDKACKERKLFSGIGVSWARRTKWVDVTNLKRFEMVFKGVTEKLP